MVGYEGEECFFLSTRILENCYGLLTFSTAIGKEYIFFFRKSPKSRADVYIFYWSRYSNDYILEFIHTRPWAKFCVFFFFYFSMILAKKKNISDDYRAMEISVIDRRHRQTTIAIAPQ